MLAHALLWAAASLLFADGLPQNAEGIRPKNAVTDLQPKTDLGESGNLLVAERFAAYKAAHPEGLCRPMGGGRRVIVTGFGLFSGVPYNISGAVVRSMADPSFWPAEVRLDEASPGAAPPTAAAQGPAGYNRRLVIDGESFDVCFLTLDVIWDLAGAIVIDEAARFKPEAILMTGRGSSDASFEAGSINAASGLSGFDSDGRSLEDNRPRSQWLLQDYPVQHALPMTWNAAELAEANRGDIRSLGYRATGQTAARRDNDYLCNNISFVVAHAMTDKPTRLAGGKLVLPSPELSRLPVVGFLHFPAVDSLHPDLQDYGEGIFGWSKVLARTLRTTLSR